MKKRSYVKEILFAIVLGIVTVKVQRAAASPDFGRITSMRFVWGFKRFADMQVRFWEEIASKAATSYNSLKP